MNERDSSLSSAGLARPYAAQRKSGRIGGEPEESYAAEESGTPDGNVDYAINFSWPAYKEIPLFSSFFRISELRGAARCLLTLVKGNP